MSINRIPHCGNYFKFFLFLILILLLMPNSIALSIEVEEPITSGVPEEVVKQFAMESHEGDFEGPSEAYEHAFAIFTGKLYYTAVDLRGGQYLMNMVPPPDYEWSVEPADAGILLIPSYPVEPYYDRSGRNIVFLPSEVENDTPVRISVKSSQVLGWQSSNKTDVSEYTWNLLVKNAPDIRGAAVTWGGKGTQDNPYVEVDSSGNSYIAGYFEGETDFDPDPEIVNSPSSESGIFLSKFDTHGKLEWVHTWERPITPYDEFLEVRINAQDCIYVANLIDIRESYPDAAFKDWSGEGDRAPGVQIRSINPDGSSGWDLTFPIAAKNFAVSDIGEVVILGQIREILDPMFGKSERIPANGYGIVKLDVFGSPAWNITSRGPLASNASVEIDHEGNIFIIGCRMGPRDNSAPLIGTGEGFQNSASEYLSEYSASGELIRTWKFHAFDDFALDSEGNIFVSGTFRMPMDFDPTDGISMLTPLYTDDYETLNSGKEPLPKDLQKADDTSVYLDCFIVKLNRDGSFDWAKSWGGRSDDEITSLATDGSGNVLVSGLFRNLVDFDPGIDEKIMDGKDGMTFLSKFDTDGNFIWARSWDGFSIQERRRNFGFITDLKGYIHLTGTLSRYADFDPGPLEWMLVTDPELGKLYNSISEPDLFLLVLPPDGNLRE